MHSTGAELGTVSLISCLPQVTVCALSAAWAWCCHQTPWLLKCQVQCLAAMRGAVACAYVVAMHGI